MKLPFSSSTRLALAISALFVALAILAGGVTYALQTRAMTNGLATDVKGLANGLAQIASQGDRQDLIEQTMALSGSVGDGSLIAVFEELKTGQTFGNANVRKAFEGPEELITGRDVALLQAADDPPDSYFAYAVTTPLGKVLVGKDEGPLIENQRILLTTMGWGLGIALLLSIGLALAIARFNAVRIAKIGRALDAVGSGHYGERIGPIGRDDLGHLADMVDQTLERLASGIEAIRQVSTDVAHDLRAPLGRLRLRLEPLALSPEVPAALRHEIGTALLEIDAISATFAAILRLARLESGSVQPISEPVDLTKLLAEIAELFGSTAEGRYRIELRTPGDPLIYPCDRDLLTQAIANLIHNCVRHCPPPVDILLSLSENAGGVVISVADRGPGIPEQDRERVLKRFVRLDASRRTPGTGLGLSLVAAIAELHRAHVILYDNQPGLRVEIRLPVKTIARMLPE